MAALSTVLAWKISLPEKPGGLRPWITKKLGHGLVTKQELCAIVMYLKKKKSSNVLLNKTTKSLTSWRPHSFLGETENAV